MAQRRHVAWGLHLVGTTGALLHHMWFNLTASHQPVPTWLYVGVAACTGVGLLYLWGRAIAAPAAVVVGGLVAWRLAPYLDDAWRQLHGGWSAHAVPREVWYSAHYTLLACVAAAATAAIAVPWTVRWLRLAAR